MGGPVDCLIPSPLLEYVLPFAILPAASVGAFLDILWFAIAAMTWLAAFFMPARHRVMLSVSL